MHSAGHSLARPNGREGSLRHYHKVCRSRLPPSTSRMERFLTTVFTLTRIFLRAIARYLWSVPPSAQKTADDSLSYASVLLLYPRSPAIQHRKPARSQSPPCLTPGP